MLSGAAMLLFAVAAAQVVLLQLFVSNPVNTHEAVGSIPFFNVLFLAYAVPAGFALRFAAEIEGTQYGRVAPFVAGLGFLLVMVYLSLETTRFFDGPVFAQGHSDAELYAYSIVWLAYALVLLALGIVRRHPILRYASLAVLIPDRAQGLPRRHGRA